MNLASLQAFTWSTVTGAVVTAVALAYQAPSPLERSLRRAGAAPETSSQHAAAAHAGPLQVSLRKVHVSPQLPALLPVSEATVELVPSTK